MNTDKAKERDKSKFYQFYDDYGHTTDECINLKDEIKGLIREGPLRKFIWQREDGTGRKNEFGLKGKARVKEDDEEPLGIINMIVGYLDSIINERKKRKQVSGELRLWQ